MGVGTQTVSFTTATGGAATVYSTKFNGKILGIKYDYGDADTGADLAVTTETTVQAVLTKENLATSDAWFYPRIATSVNTSGAASTVLFEPIWVVDERVKFAVTNGADAKTGAFVLLIDVFPFAT